MANHRTKHREHTDRSDPQCIACRREDLVELQEHETRGQEATMKYRVTYELNFTNRRAAERAWQRLQPGPNAGSAARFEVRCEACDQWQDATVEYPTCACGVRPFLFGRPAAIPSDVSSRSSVGRGN